MITFCIALLLLVAGYFVYGALVEKVLGLIRGGRHLPIPRQTVSIIFLCRHGKFFSYNF